MRKGEIIVTLRFDDLFVNHFECLENGSKLLSAVILFPHVSNIVLNLLLHWNLRIPLVFDLRDTKLKGVPDAKIEDVAVRGTRRLCQEFNRMGRFFAKFVQFRDIYLDAMEIERVSCRERVCQYVKIQ